MSDRELLELAAKAAGVIGGWSDYHQAICYSRPGNLDMLVWRPLADDGDALRLAVKIGIDMFHVWDGGQLGRGAHFESGTAGAVEHADADGDLYAATRRAIVRAAAEIGRAMSDKPLEKVGG